MKPFEIRFESEITYTPEQASDPKLMACLKQQAQAVPDKEVKAAVEARRNRLLSHGLVLVDENTVTVDLGKLWRWNLKRMAPQIPPMESCAQIRHPAVLF